MVVQFLAAFMQFKLIIDKRIGTNWTVNYVKRMARLYRRYKSLLFDFNLMSVPGLEWNLIGNTG